IRHSPGTPTAAWPEDRSRPCASSLVIPRLSRSIVRLNDERSVEKGAASPVAITCAAFANTGEIYRRCGPGRCAFKRVVSCALGSAGTDSRVLQAHPGTEVSAAGRVPTERCGGVGELASSRA